MDPMESVGGYQFSDDFHDFSQINFAPMDDLPTQSNPAQDSDYSEFPGLVDPPSQPTFHFKTAFDPSLQDSMLKDMQDSVHQQSQSVYNEPLTRIPSPGGIEMSSMQPPVDQQQMWPVLATSEQKMNLPQLDTQCNGYQQIAGPIQQIQPMVAEPSNLSVGECHLTEA